MQSKWKGNDQESIQSHPTFNPQNQKQKNDTHKIKDTHSKPKGQLFPKEVNIQLHVP